MLAPLPSNEIGRIGALEKYCILDTPIEEAYDEISQLAAQVCQCPISYISFIDSTRTWLKAKYGLPPELTQCPREITFCATTVGGCDLVVAEDLATDVRFRDLPFVTGEPFFKFYCGMPLITPDGYAIGTLCVIDFEKRQLSFEQRETLHKLSRQVLTQLELRRRLVDLKASLQELDAARHELTKEKARSDELLENILPKSVVEELKINGKVEPRYYQAATILFTDFKGFTKLTEHVEPAALLMLLEQYFSAFDGIVERHHLEKLKTIGDAYMVAGGIPETNRTHTVDVCLAGLEMLGVVARMRAQREKVRLPFLEARIGVHTGPVIAGVVGHRKFTYDIWGDAVNIAARMESSGEAGRINISEDTCGRVRALFEVEERGSIAAKNKEPLKMWYLNRIKPEFSRDADGRTPNERFSVEQKRLLTGYASGHDYPDI